MLIWAGLWTFAIVQTFLQPWPPGARVSARLFVALGKAVPDQRTEWVQFQGMSVQITYLFECSATRFRSRRKIHTEPHVLVGSTTELILKKDRFFSPNFPKGNFWVSDWVTG